MQAVRLRVRTASVIDAVSRPSSLAAISRQRSRALPPMDH
jgi:hypothetical protein